MSERFVLRWHYQELTLLKNLSSFLESDLLTDVTISVDSHTLRAHKLVLAMCSVYFFQLFQEMGDAQHPVVVLHGVAFDDVKAVLAFIYRGQCVVSRDQLPGLLSLAKLLKIQGLCDMKVPEKAAQPRAPEDDGAADDEDDAVTTKRPPKDLSETCKCFLCGKYLSNQYNLRVHMETHEEAYHACQSCPHVSRSRDALRKHVSYRHPEEYHTRKRKKI